ncbi:ubiquinone biosynthesis accessory factor UbiJ [Psychromonas antarctica]|uniref:ubiquinone biosynthesis accessory factor UbiJ n=1 Tax=Psychromonas antarctica TaxID=67573 RepID=UPI001EE9A856|nr:SCP2 sterol-binding domain-containing protein [Psychromonas antarctica]MCG6201403.1 SCP2 sterol-binding domain-containing protein [Psychromonas antarctica]
MPLDNLVCGLLETAINQLQQLDSTAVYKRKVLDGIVIAVMLKELNKPLYFVISKQHIDVLARYEGQTDCFIRLNISALKELHNNHQLTALIKSERLEVEGDIQLAQKFAQLLMAMEIDWEELLSSKVGDVLAHKLCYHVKQCRQGLSQQQQKIEQQCAEFISEELRLAPGPLQVAYFCEQVSELEKQCALLETRMTQCLCKIEQYGIAND